MDLRDKVEAIEDRSFLPLLRMAAKAVLAFALVTSLIATGLLAVSLPRTAKLPSALISPSEGFSFYVSSDSMRDLLVPPILLYLYAPYSDGLAESDKSELVIREDGRKLGPAHQMHVKIRSDGGGAYSNWDGALYMATSDNSDVRTNGRSYELETYLHVTPQLERTLWISIKSALIVALCAALSIIFLYRRRHCSKAIRRWTGDLDRPGAGVAMSELFRTPGILAVDPTTASRIRRSMLFGARLIFWPLALLTLVALALHLGAWRKEFKIAGPFADEANPPRHSLILAVPQEGPAEWWRQPLLGDDNGKPFRSFLELRIDGRKMGPPHSLHETIREGTTEGFSHWGPNLIFSLPPGAKNAPETVATLRYSVQPRTWVTLVLIVLSAPLGWLLYNRALSLLAEHYWALTSRARERPAAVVLRAPYLILFGLCCVGLAGSAVYVASSLYALATGWALPTTALIRWSPAAQWAARNEPYLGYLLLMVAGLGAPITWLVGSKAPRQEAVELNEQLLRRILVLCGFPLVACAFIICISAMWTGILRPGDSGYFNIGGLIPFSDAGAYLTASHDQAKDGFWNEVALRRPLAAAFRSVLLVLGDFSLPLMLILQACLVAAATCFAANAVAVWRGIWAGIAFFALIYIYARYFVPTTLTEALGLFWALLSIPFFIETFRSRSVKPALVGFTMTTVALMTRMGSMLTIPALLVWLVWQFGQGAAAKLRICAASCGILLGILGLNSLLQNAYESGPSPATGNFSYVLCGLTIGTAWDGCVKKLASEGKPFEEGEAARAEQLYSMAWKNFRAEPSVFFYRVASGVGAFATQFPNTIWQGYGSVPKPNWLWRNSLTAICLIGLLYGLVRRTAAVELTFWMLFWISIVASASIVYFDDGSRTLAASQPLIALFFAMGMSSPVLAARGLPARPRLSRYGSLGLIVTAALFVSIPWMAHRFSPIRTMVGNSLLQKQDEAFVFGGRRMSGFLVVEDGLPLRNDIPMLHLADFEAIIKRSDVELFQELLHPVTPPLPFGFVFAPRLEKGILSIYQYIVPAEVVERRDVPAWHFQFKRWGYKPSGYGEYWFYVTKAEPWP